LLLKTRAILGLPAWSPPLERAQRLILQKKTEAEAMHHAEMFSVISPIKTFVVPNVDHF
jgi:hypothetical protein